MASTLPPLSSLPLKHQRFIVEYLQDQNATQAAIRAGYKPDNADVQGSQLLGKLRAYVEPVGKAHIEKRIMKAKDVVDGLVRIATADIRDYVTWEGNDVRVKSSDELTDEQAYCIESVQQHETQHTKYIKLKLHSKVKALDALAKYHNLFKQVLASKGLMVVYQRPPKETLPDDAVVVEGQVIEGKFRPLAKSITFKRPEGANGHSNGKSNGHAKNGLHTGDIRHDQGTA